MKKLLTNFLIVTILLVRSQLGFGQTTGRDEQAPKIIGEDPLPFSHPKKKNVLPAFKLIENTKDNADPIRISITADKKNIVVGEEVELTITAELLNIRPSEMFFFEELKGYTLIVIEPQGFIRTGGNFKDYESQRLSQNTPKVEYKLKGFFESQPKDSVGLFSVLRGPFQVNSQSLFSKKTFSIEVSNVPKSIALGSARTSTEADCANFQVSASNYGPICSGSEITIYAQGCQGTLEGMGLNPQYGSAFGKFYPEYNANGYVDYVITCREQDKTCTRSIRVFVKPNPPKPIITTIPAPPVIKTNQDVTLSGLCPGGTMTWEFMDPAPRPLPSPDEPPTAGLVGGIDPNVPTILMSCPPPCNNPNYYQVGVPGSYFGVCTINGCSTRSDPVIVTKCIPPPRPTVTATRYGVWERESTTLTASGCDGLVQWNNENYTGSSITITPTSTVAYDAKCIKDGCESALSERVTIVYCPNFYVPVQNVSICEQTPVTLTANGCVGPSAQIVWSNGATGNSITVSPSSTTNYTVTCTAGEECIQSKVITVNVHSKPTKPTLSASSVAICVGQSTQLQASNYTGTIVWPQGNSVVSPTVSTEYSIRAVQTYGSLQCQSDESKIYITVNPIPNPPTVSTNLSVICSNQSATLTATGCAGGLISWNNGQIGSQITVQPSNTTEYSATCQQNGCNSALSNTITLTVNQKPSAPYISWINAPNLPANLLATGCSGTVQWSNETSNFSGASISVSAAGNYTAFCQLNGCVSDPSNVVSVTTPTCTSSLSISVSSTTICAGEQVFLTASSCDGTLSWNNGQSTPTISISPTTNTTVTAQCQKSGCATVSASAVISVIPRPNAPSISPANGSILPGQTIQLTAQGCSGIVRWNTGSTGNVLTVNQPGSYSATCESGSCVSLNSNVVVIGAGSCSANIALSASKQTACVGENITISATGCSGSINWSNGLGSQASVSVQPSTSTTYSATCTLSGCAAAVASVSINVLTPPNAPVISPTQTNELVGSSVTLNAQGCAGSVVWSNGHIGSQLVASYPAGTYTFTAICVTNGCSSTPSGTATINFQPAGTCPSSISISGNNTICAGASTTLTAQGCTGGSLSWQPSGNTQNSILVSPSNTTTYTVTCQVSNCQPVSQSVVVSVKPSPPSPTISPSNTQMTVGTTLTLTATGCSGTVRWNDGSLGTTLRVIPSVGSNTYSAVCIVDNCSSNSATATVVADSGPQCPSIRVSAAKLSICAGETTTLTASGCTGTLRWTHNNANASTISVSPSTTTAYTAECTAPDCPGSGASMIITVNPIPNAPVISSNKSTIQAGEVATLSASGCTGNVRWSTGQTGTSINITATAVGTLTFTATCRASGCGSGVSNTISVSVTPGPVCNFVLKRDPTNGEGLLGDAIKLTATRQGNMSSTSVFAWEHATLSHFVSSPAEVDVTRTRQGDVVYAKPTTTGTFTYKASVVGNTSCSQTVSIAVKAVTCDCTDCDAAEWQTQVVSANAAYVPPASVYQSVVENTFLGQTTTPTGTTEIIQAIQFADGWGRPVQAIQRGISPTGQDLIQPIEYDALSRSTKNFLPYVANSGGQFIPNAPTAQAAFYQTLKSDPNAFALMLLEKSPRQRPLQEGSIGTEYQPDENNPNKAGPNKYAYRHNTEVNIVKLGNNGSLWSLGSYGTNELFVTEYRDALNNRVEVFEDIFGQTVCRKVYNGAQTLTTYMAYDDFGRLRLIFPPKASAVLQGMSQQNYNFTNVSTLNSQIYWYQYDAKGRLIEKKTPDAELEEMVYNPYDQLVLYRNGLNRTDGQWLYTKYDEVGRVYSRGHYNSTQTRSQLQSIVNGNFAQGKFNDTAFPTATQQEYVQYYYDSYSGLGVSANPSQPVEFGLVAISESSPVTLKGKRTGMVERVLRSGAAPAVTDNTLTTAYYYDQYGRTIQTSAQTLVGTDLSSMRYDFAGRLLETKMNGIWNRYSYDPGNRLKMACQRITNNVTKTEPVGRYRYNELGELIEKWQGCKIQISQYTYDLQGRLKALNSPNPTTLQAQKRHYGFALNYDLLSNITQQTWGTVPHFRAGATLPAQRQYQYNYDALSRLKGATYTGGANENFDLSNLDYDSNGNITRLTRRVQTPSLGNSPTEDDLFYYYTPNTNRLRNVHDAGNANPNNAKKNQYFWDRNVKNEASGYNNNANTDDYAYDAAGNLTRDRNRDITNIKYNALGLPEQVNIGTSSNRIYYYYTGTGRKLRKDGAYVLSNNTQIRIDYTATGIYINGILEVVNTIEGRALRPMNIISTYHYEYQQNDHLGNLRTSCRCGLKFENVGALLTIQPTQTNEDPRTLFQENHYDPWGLNLADIETYPPHNLANSPYRDWQQFSGKERDQVAYTEFEFRHYDPATGRFTSVDPLADAFTFLNPFNYADNNPTTMIDLYGLQAVKAGGGAAIQGAGGAAQATKSFGALRFIGAISGAVNLAQSLKQSAPNPIGAALGGFVGGVGEAVVRNIKAVTVNLPETIKGVASLNNPVGQMQAAAGAGMLYEKTKSDWNTGDIRTRSNIIGNIVGEAAIAFAGTKGVGNLVKAARVAKGGRIIITRSVGAAPKEFSTVLQSGGHTLNNSTLKTLGLTKEQGKIAIEALKTDLRLPANFHGKIMGNGDLVHPHTREVLGNLFDYLH